jgi:tetratricopeptide (TPR) repeat protein
VRKAAGMRGTNISILISAVALLVALPVASQAQFTPNAANNDTQLADHASAQTEVPPVSLLAAERVGDQFMDQGRYHAALDVYSGVPSPSAKLWARMGIAYQFLFSFDGAVRCYKQALKLEPNNARNLNNLATVLDQQGKHREAERLYRKAITLAPNSATYIKNLGTNLLAQHEFQKGSEEYKRALALDPHVLDSQSNPAMILPKAENAETNYARARSCAEARATECAVTYLRKALQEDSATRSRVTKDREFEAVLNDPALQQLLSEQK